MYTYIKQSIPGYYFRPEEPLTTVNCDVLGSTWQDFLDDKFVPLTMEQCYFAKQNPNASIKEVFEMKLNEVPVFERTLEQAKQEKLNEIARYDNSPAVNSFVINNTIQTWFTPAERSNYKQSVESAELLGVPTLQFYVNNTLLEVETAKAKQMLAMIHLYADKCFIVTMQHKLAVEQLETIEEVDSYDYKVGYPSNPNFTL